MMNKMRVRRYASSALVAVSIFGLTACGGGKPSEDEVAKKLTAVYTEAGAPKDQAKKISDCAAPKFVKELSNDVLKKIVDEDIKDLKKAKAKEKDQEAASKISEDCARKIITP